jgi:hypothetical protein
LFFLFFANPVVAQQPYFHTVDIEVGATEQVQFPDGKRTTVKLLSISETRDKARSAIREARAEVEINGSRTTLSCGNYRLPATVGQVQADCTVTKAYYQNTDHDHWVLEKDARLRLWPGGSPFMPPGSMVYPVRQRWFASRTQMANEPTYVDENERITSAKIYYHAGLDIGGAEGLVEVLAATDGFVVGLGTAVVDQEKDNASLDQQFNDTIWVRDERGWYHRYTHLYSFEPSVKAGRPGGDGTEDRDSRERARERRLGTPPLQDPQPAGLWQTRHSGRLARENETGLTRGFALTLRPRDPTDIGPSVLQSC